MSLVVANDGQRLQGPFEAVCSTGERGEWLRERTGGIGASEMAAVMGLYKYSSALEVYARKVGVIDAFNDDAGEPAYWGNQLEDLVVREFAKRTGKVVVRQQHLLRSTVYPWALSTLDAAVFPEAVPVEAKTASAYLLDDWTDGTPLYYRIQCHQQMLVTGARYVYAACLVGGQKFVWDVVERDEALISQIIDAGTKFWRCVQEQVPPPPDGSESAERALAAMVSERVEDIDRRPVLSAELVGVGSELDQVQLDLRALNASVKSLTKKRSELQQQIRLAMDGSKYAELGGWVYVDEHRKRAGYSAPPAEWHELRRSTYEDEVGKATRKAKAEDRKARAV